MANPQKGVFSFGPQTAKESVATTFYRHKAGAISLGVLDDQRVGEMEVGGEPTPSTPYKAGVLVSGGVTLNPRLEDTFGWLLYAALGGVTTTADSPELGLNEHKFAFASDPNYLPYMTMRKHIPSNAVANDLGEVYNDCKVLGLNFVLPNDGLIAAQATAMGRSFTLEDPSTWTYQNTYESYISIPNSATVGGYIKIPGYSASGLEVTQASVGIQNQPASVREEKIYGSPFIDEVDVLSRAMSVDLMVRWKDHDLYRSILTGSGAGSAWTPDPFVQDLEIWAESPANIGALSNPYSLKIEASKVMYACSPITLAAGNLLQMRIQGQVITDVTQYCAFTLTNEVTAYTWPT